MHMARALFGAGVLVALVVGTAAPAAAAYERHRDPLNDKEIDQLREAATDPPQRLKLWVKFARARMDQIDDVRAAPKMADPDRAQHTHDLLEDLGSMMDEISDNIENFDHENADLRKPLPEVIAMDNDFRARLRALKDKVSKDPKLAAEYSDFNFALQNTIDAVNSCGDLAREVLQAQIEKAKEAKEKAKKK
jgi:hypothetical protein